MTATMIKNYANSMKEAICKVISGEMTLADNGMYLRAVMTDLDKIVDEAEKSEGKAAMTETRKLSCDDLRQLCIKNAAPSFERLSALQIAKWRGIKTWVSCEPVIEPQAVYALIQSANYIDLFRIGKMNHHPSGINWAAFGAKCVELCEVHGREYYIKDDLRAEMEGKQCN